MYKIALILVDIKNVFKIESIIKPKNQKINY